MSDWKLPTCFSKMASMDEAAAIISNNWEFCERTGTGVKRRRWSYPVDLARKVFEAARDGKPVELRNVLEQMTFIDRGCGDTSERTTVLETKTSLRTSLGFDGEITPLIAAVEKGNVNCVKLLLMYNADIEGRGRNEFFGTFTPSFIAAATGRLDVLSCLVANGADVNARTHNSWTPLMAASSKGHVDVVTFLVTHGADMNLQDQEGNTALHRAVMYSAVCGRFDKLSSRVAHRLLALGSPQTYNNQGLTPLLLATMRCTVSVAEDLIMRPEVTTEQRIEALELLGASIAINTDFSYHVIKKNERSCQSFRYVRQGMEQRYQDPSHPLLKQAIKPVKAYQNRKESETLEELAQIEGDFDAIFIEGLIITERILGADSRELLDPIRHLADYHMGSDRDNFDLCIGLYRHALKIAQHNNRPISSDLYSLTRVLHNMVRCNFLPSQNVVLEVLEETVLDYEKQTEKLRKELETESLEIEEAFKKQGLKSLLNCLLSILQLIAIDECCASEEDRNSPYRTSISLSVLMRKLSCLNPRNDHGNTLLHMAAESNGVCDFYSEFPCPETMKLLLNAGFNVNATNNNGDTPLHVAVTFKPSDDKIHVLTGMLEVLLKGGTHHDFVNSDGKTAMEMARTDEASRILFEKRKLELKCTAAKAVKKFGIPYLGMVPKTLEKYVSMH